MTHSIFFNAQKPIFSTNTPQFGKRQLSPKICIIEPNLNLYADIDGDGVLDLPHGEVIRRILLSFLPQAEVVIKPFEDLPTRYKNSQLQWQDRLKKALKWSQKQNFDFINLSLSSSIPYEGIQCNGKDVTPDSLPSTALVKYFKNTPSLYIHKLLGQVFKSIEVLVADGKPVFVGSSNQNHEFNLYNLAQGATHVGGLDSRLRKVNAFSSNSLLSCYSQAVFNISRVRGGYDITGDGNADVKTSEVSGKGKITPFVDKFKGQKLEDALVKPYEVSAIKLLLFLKPLSEIEAFEKKLFTFDQLIELNLVNPKDVSGYNQISPYAAINSNTGKWFFGFKEGEHGQVVYDPDGSGRDAVSAICGNSYATPVALAEAAGGFLIRDRS